MLIKYIKYPSAENNNGWIAFDHCNLPDTDKEIVIISKGGRMICGRFCLLRTDDESYFDENEVVFYRNDTGSMNKPDGNIDCDVLSIYPLDSIACWKYEDFE